MNVKFLLKLYKSKKTGSKSLDTRTMIKYYIKLKFGEITKKIYKNSIKTEMDHTSKYKNPLEIFEEHIKKTMNVINLGNEININQKKGLENIGIGCVLTPAMFGNLIAVTQYCASFYFKTPTIREYTIEINLLGIVSVSGDIKINGKKMKQFSISTLTDQKIIIQIGSEVITNEILEIQISVDRCWSPHFLDNKLPDFPLGVGIKSIYCS